MASLSGISRLNVDYKITVGILARLTVHKAGLRVLMNYSEEEM